MGNTGLSVNVSGIRASLQMARVHADPGRLSPQGRVPASDSGAVLGPRRPPCPGTITCPCRGSRGEAGTAEGALLHLLVGRDRRVREQTVPGRSSNSRPGAEERTCRRLKASLRRRGGRSADLGNDCSPLPVLLPLQPRGSLAGAAFCLRARGRPGCVPGRSGFPAASTPGLLGGCRLPPPGGVHPGPGPSGPGVSFQRNLHLDRAVEAQSGWQTVWGTPQTPQPLLFPQIPILGPCGAFVTSQQPTPMRHYSPFPGSIETLLVLPSMVPSCPRPSEEGGRPAHGPFSGTRDLHGASLGTPAATSGSGGPCQVCPL